MNLSCGRSVALPQACGSGGDNDNQLSRLTPLPVLCRLRAHQNSSLFVTSSDFLAIGKAYSRVPFAGHEHNPSQAPPISAVLSGAFLGAGQPNVLCAFTTNATAATSNVTCAILQLKQFRLQWIVPSQLLPFSLLLGAAAPAASTAVELFVADLDGDGLDEMVAYTPSSGRMQRWMLRAAPALGANVFQFERDVADTVPVIDALPSGSLAVQLTNQQIFAGRLVDCACPLSSSSALPPRCSLAMRNRTMLLPPQSEFSIAPITLRPPANLTAQPGVIFTLESRAANTVPSDDLILLDPESGRIQLLASCVGSDGSLTLQRLLSAPSWLPPGARLSLASIRGVDETLDLVVTPAPALSSSSAGVGAAARIKFFRVGWTGSVPARLEYLHANQGDLARIQRALQRKGGAAAEQVEVAWMRIQKPRIIAPESDPLVNVRVVERITFVNGSAVANASASSTATSVAADWIPVFHPSPESSSFLRHDAVVWNGARSLLHFVAATFVSTMPRDRAVTPATEGAWQQGERTVSTKYARIDVNSPDSSSLAASAVSSARGWLGERSFVFSFSQRALSDLGGDPDGDSISTRNELGFSMDSIAPLGFLSNATFLNTSAAAPKGLRFEPLSALGCSPFRKDVLVEVDYMRDGAKSMRPFDGFDEPAREDFAAHGIALHVHVDDEEPIPRVGNLGGSSFSWGEHIFPLKYRYFNPIHRGFFHYCLFLDSFGGGSVSGQSVSVPANDFFVSLGGWGDGHGSLQQQAGTFLHELGHNMNLLHGGNDGNNWKINHLSVMNYQCQ